MPYCFKEDRIKALRNGDKADAQIIGETIEATMQANGGRLSPRDLWAPAENNPSHPLYPFFNWNIREAAEAHWDATARGIIQIIARVDDDAEPPRPAFISITDHKGAAYRNVKEIMQSRDLQLRLLKQAEAELDSFQKRYRSLIEVCERVAKARKILQEQIALHDKHVA